MPLGSGPNGTWAGFTVGSLGCQIPNFMAGKRKFKGKFAKSAEFVPEKAGEKRIAVTSEKNGLFCVQEFPSSAGRAAFADAVKWGLAENGLVDVTPVGLKKFRTSRTVCSVIQRAAFHREAQPRVKIAFCFKSVQNVLLRQQILETESFSAEKFHSLPAKSDIENNPLVTLPTSLSNQK